MTDAERKKTIETTQHERASSVFLVLVNLNHNTKGKDWHLILRQQKMPYAEH